MKIEGGTGFNLNTLLGADAANTAQDSGEAVESRKTTQAVTVAAPPRPRNLLENNFVTANKEPSKYVLGILSNLRVQNQFQDKLTGIVELYRLEAESAEGYAGKNLAGAKAAKATEELAEKEVRDKEAERMEEERKESEEQSEKKLEEKATGQSDDTAAAETAPVEQDDETAVEQIPAEDEPGQADRQQKAEAPTAESAPQNGGAVEAQPEETGASAAPTAPQEGSTASMDQMRVDIVV
ncbi:hypothetical protein [Oceanidesulfovibrio marinus]|uniref:Uncharacterized protein n=1 Tax=Oceanidesulfovibrio marinus TaxID=370038 RepID=A0ABX6NGF7_9BACT|nr:hypothetical protein [Oceanidesulfovibrio marinus]QJT09658.1 hypothetical protein E8L03_12250 [Oceanidesulfovibrio marinus]